MAIATALATGSRVLEEFIREHAADHELIGAAEERGNHVFAHRGDEHQQGPGDDARHRQGQRNAQEGLPRARSQISRRLQERAIVLLEVGVQRQDHERE